MRNNGFHKFIIKSLCVISSISICSCRARKIKPTNMRPCTSRRTIRIRSGAMFGNQRFKNRRFKSRKFISRKSENRKLRRRKFIKRGAIGTVGVASTAGLICLEEIIRRSYLANRFDDLPSMMGDVLEEQQGDCWCVYASIVNLFKMNGIKKVQGKDVTQENIYCLINKKEFPPPHNNRYQGIDPGCDDVRNFLEQVATENNLHLNFVSFHPRLGGKVKNIGRNAYKYMVQKFWALNGKKPFVLNQPGSISDNLGHCIVVISVSNDKITIWDPLHGKQTKKLNDYDGLRLPSLFEMSSMFSFSNEPIENEFMGEYVIWDIGKYFSTKSNDKYVVENGYGWNMSEVDSKLLFIRYMPEPVKYQIVNDKNFWKT